jgi:hypothetical protein
MRLVGFHHLCCAKTASWPVCAAKILTASTAQAARLSKACARLLRPPPQRMRRNRHDVSPDSVVAERGVDAKRRVKLRSARPDCTKEQDAIGIGIVLGVLGRARQMSRRIIVRSKVRAPQLVSRRRRSRGEADFARGATNGPSAATIISSSGRGRGACRSSAARIAARCSGLVPQQPPMIRAPASIAKPA